MEDIVDKLLKHSRELDELFSIKRVTRNDMITKILGLSSQHDGNSRRIFDGLIGLKILEYEGRKPTPNGMYIVNWYKINHHHLHLLFFSHWFPNLHGQWKHANVLEFVSGNKKRIF